MGKIRQGINKIKDKFRKKNTNTNANTNKGGIRNDTNTNKKDNKADTNTTKSDTIDTNNAKTNTNKEDNKADTNSTKSDTVDTNNVKTNNNISDSKIEDTNTPSKSYGTVKYKFKSKDYIKDFDDEYNKVSKYIDDMIEYIKLPKFDKDKYSDYRDSLSTMANQRNENEFPTSMDDLKKKVLDLSENKDNYNIESEEELNVLLNTKPEKYIDITNKLQTLSDYLKEEQTRIHRRYGNWVKKLRMDARLAKESTVYLINYATLILQQIQ